METYLVWSHEHSAWWRPNSAGYTVHVKAAGRYSRDEAIEICRARIGWQNDKPPAEIPVRLDDVIECWLRMNKAKAA